MPKFKITGKHHLTGKNQTLIYEAEDAAGAAKRAWDEGMIVETTTPMEQTNSGDTTLNYPLHNAVSGQ